MSDAIFVSVNKNYVPYLNAFLNSLEKRKLTEKMPDIVVYVLYCEDTPQDYISAIRHVFPFVRTVKIDPSEIGFEPMWSNAWFAKAGRYYYLKKLGFGHDVCCLMDADLFLVSQNFSNMFELVRNTKLLIGCNERIKWEISPEIHQLNSEPILPVKTRLSKFHCNVPLFLDIRHWTNVIDDYLNIVFKGREKRGDNIKVIGDIYSWNMAVYRQNKQDDVVLFPMETMTQVHLAGARDWTRLEIARDGQWTTWSGDEVFTIHGRPDRKGWRKVDIGKHKDIQPGIYERYCRYVEREWFDLNFRQKLVLSDYLGMKPEWEALA